VSEATEIDDLPVSQTTMFIGGLRDVMDRR